MEIVWLIAMMAFLFIEANTVSVVSAWFAAGSLAALIATLCGAQLWLQITIALAVSVALLACLRPLVRKYIRPKVVKTNIDAIIGTQGYVTADIDNVSALGQVKLGAMEWSARSTSGEAIAKGTLVQVDKIEGVRAFVSPVEVEAKV